MKGKNRTTKRKPEEHAYIKLPSVVRESKNNIKMMSNDDVYLFPPR